MLICCVAAKANFLRVFCIKTAQVQGANRLTSLESFHYGSMLATAVGGDNVFSGLFIPLSVCPYVSTFVCPILVNVVSLELLEAVSLN